MRQQETLGNLNGHIEEMYTGHTIIKAFGQESQSINTFNEINDKLMKNGSVIEKGSHEELLAQQGFYADLYKSQFSVNFTKSLL